MTARVDLPAMPPRDPVARPRWLWAPVVVYMAAIFVLSSFSELPAPPGGLSDRGGHASLYAGLGLLLVRALAGGRAVTVRAATAALAVAIAAAYGLSDEIHQRFVPGRQFELRDLAADVAGASAAAGLAWAWGIIRRHQERP
jgi:VanZ family protein